MNRGGSPFFKLMQKVARKEARDSELKFKTNTGETVRYERYRDGSLYLVTRDIRKQVRG